MSHWLRTAISTYLLHSEHGNGYQWWSGPGADLGYASILLALWHRHSCHEPRCPALVRHGRTYCKRHARRPLHSDEIGHTTSSHGDW